VKAGDLYKDGGLPIKDKILGLFKSDKNAAFVMEFFKETTDEEKKIDIQMSGYMSQYDVAKLCNWDLAIKGHQDMLKALLPSLESSDDWDMSKPYEAMMKKQGELRYWFEKEGISSTQNIETHTDREVGKLNKSGTLSKTFKPLYGL